MDDDDCRGLTLRSLVNRHIREIGEIGYTTVSVAANELEPGWVYTVGLSHHGDGSELLTIGLPPVKAQLLICELAVRVTGGENIDDGRYGGAGLPISPVRIERVGDIWCSASDYFNLGRIILDEGWGTQRWPATKQVVWADRSGRFPDQLPLGRAERFIQPRLVEPTEVANNS